MESGSFMQMSTILSARARRKGTENSIELALIECASESESDGKDRYQAIVTSIREELM
jgi:hypothetical protein